MIKTIGSFRQAIGQPSEIIHILKDMGYEYAPIADISSTFMWVKWQRECEKHGLKPVFGVSLYVTDNPSAKRPKTDLWAFYAIDDIAAVNKLVRLATSQFKYNPLLTYQQAMDAEGVIKVAGYSADLDLIEPQENLFIGLSPACAKGYVNAAAEKGFTFVDWQEQRYPKKEDFHTWEVACGRNARETTYPRHILGWEEFMDWTLQYDITKPEKCEYLIDQLKKCTATLKQGTMIKPDQPMSLRDMCIAGAEKIGLDLSQPEYQERLDLELKVISDKDFEDYFYLVADLVQNVSKTQLVGPGRGSSAGSLVCYLLGITQLDPIKHGLLFFRFLDPARTDIPDCDIDFSDRDAAVEYLVEKYGIDRVAKLGTLAKWQAKNTTNEVCKALLISRPEAQKVLDVIPDYAAGDSRSDTALRDALDNTSEGKNYLNRYPEFKIAGEMSGNPSHAGVHAAGVVVTNDPIDNFIAVNSQKNSTMCDLKEAEELNLLKLDVLGLDTLTIIDECLKLAGLSRDHLKNLPLDDQKAFQVLNDQKYLGIFQFESTVIGLAKEFYIQSFDDISALMALGRPGPLSSGAAHRWLKKRQGQMEVGYPHEVLKPYLEGTFGELIYQETLMLIAHEVAGMDWPTVSKLRKAVGKSQGEAAMRGFELEFVDGLVKSGIERDIAESFWQQVVGFGQYSFNKSHTACYGLICYWTAYLKAHFPLHFAAASLTQKKDPEKQLEFLRELDKEGIGYVPVDPELSTDKWRVMDNKLIGPLSTVHGLGAAMQRQILSARARNEPLPDRALKLLDNPKTKIDELYPIKKRIEALNKDKFAGEIKLAHEIKCDGTWQENLLVVGIVEKCSVEDENTESRIQGRLSRGQQGRYDGPHKFVELRVASDMGSLYTKIGRNDFQRLSPMVVGKVKEGETLVAVRGKLCPMDDFELLLVDKVRILEDGN